MSAKSTVTCLRSPSTAARASRMRWARCGGVYAPGEAKRPASGAPRRPPQAGQKRAPSGAACAQRGQRLMRGPGASTCSGRIPTPTSRAGSRPSSPWRPRTVRSRGGARRPFCRPSVGEMTRRCARSCSHWVTRVGHSRRRCTRRRCSVVRRPSRSGIQSRFAAATASWIARLIPTPPTGDIACAASPMQSSPGRYHWRSRSTFTVRSLTSSQSRISPTRSAANGTSAATEARKASSPRRRTSSAAPLGMT